MSTAHERYRRTGVGSERSLKSSPLKLVAIFSHELHMCKFFAYGLSIDTDLDDLVRRNSPYFLRFSPNSIALLANYVTVVEDL